MKKIKFTDTELQLIHNFADYKLKSEILEQLNKNYKFNEEIKFDWFDNKEDYQSAIDTIRNRDTNVRKLIAKLNQISDKEFEKLIS